MTHQQPLMKTFIPNFQLRGLRLNFEKLSSRKLCNATNVKAILRKAL